MAKQMRESGGGRGVSDPWATGSDASYIKPKFIPDDELLGRDDSGGPEWDPRTAQFGDGGDVTGDKAHLSAKGGSDDSEENDEVSSMPRERAARRAEGEGSASPKSARSRKD